MSRTAILVLLLITAAPAWAHDSGDGSWMNQGNLIDPVTKDWCCNEQDCAPVPAGGVVMIDIFAIGGSSNAQHLPTPPPSYLITETGEHIPEERVIWRSPDGRWWRCRNLGGEHPGSTRCLIGPPRGM
jgi:hypothetical protein